MDRDRHKSHLPAIHFVMHMFKKFINDLTRYPNCLGILHGLIQDFSSDERRREAASIASPEQILALHKQQYYQWLHRIDS